MDKSPNEKRSEALNPNNPKYQGGTTAYTGPRDKHVMDDKSTKANPNNPKYEKGRQN